MNKGYNKRQMKEVLIRIRRNPWLDQITYNQERNELHAIFKIPGINVKKGRLHTIYKGTKEYLQFYSGDPELVDIEDYNQSGVWNFPKFEQPEPSIIDLFCKGANAVYNACFCE